ncbi:MAG: hypothetical protein HY200_03995 [Nitrospirae bacterium]|nr:hypothetical protein [Nitrospirota bacterium]
MDFGTTLIFSMIFGTIGVGYFIYGKRQGKMTPLWVGVALNVFPFLVSNIYEMVIIGIILSGLPWFFRS